MSFTCISKSFSFAFPQLYNFDTCLSLKPDYKQKRICTTVSVQCFIAHIPSTDICFCLNKGMSEKSYISSDLLFSPKQISLWKFSQRRILEDYICPHVHSKYKFRNDWGKLLSQAWVAGFCFQVSAYIKGKECMYTVYPSQYECIPTTWWPWNLAHNVNHLFWGQDIFNTFKLGLN